MIPRKAGAAESEIDSSISESDKWGWEIRGERGTPSRRPPPLSLRLPGMDCLVIQTLCQRCVNVFDVGTTLAQRLGCSRDIIAGVIGQSPSFLADERVGRCGSHADNTCFPISAGGKHRTVHKRGQSICTPCNKWICMCTWCKWAIPKVPQRVLYEAASFR